MLELFIILFGPYLVKVIHVELSDETRELGVLEGLRQYLFFKSIGAVDDEPITFGIPCYYLAILKVL